MTGTLAGVGVSALLGSVIAPRGDKGAGAVIGAVGGGVIGSEATRPQADCAHAYGYYDRDGDWVDGAPNGAYDRDNRWSPAGASGYYDAEGHWIAGPANGAYDAQGHWMPGAANGHLGADGVWVQDPQPGYYDGYGRWRAGAAQGRYDERGVWISSSTGGMGAGAGYVQPRRDIDTRAAWLEKRVHAAADDGVLSRHDAGRALRELDRVRPLGLSDRP